MLSEFRPKKKHKLSLFGRWMLIIAAICLCIVLGVLVFLWSYLEDYEKHTPKYYATQYIELLKKEDYAGAMKLIGIEETALVSTDDFAAYMKEVFSDGFENVKIYEASQEDDDTRTCNIYVGNTKRLSLGFTDSGKKSRHHFTEWKFSLQNLPNTDYVITAPAFVGVRVNDHLLTKEQAASEQVAYQEYTGMSDAAEAPQEVTYHVSGLLRQPQVTAVLSDGKQYETNISLEGNRFTINVVPEASDQKEFTQMAIEDAKTYAKFITKDATFTQLSKRLYPDTEFYRNMSSFYNGWYNKHENHGFENIKTENLWLLDEDAFLIDVSFQYYVIKSNKRHDFQANYTMAYRNTDKGWRLVGLTVK